MIGWTPTVWWYFLPTHSSLSRSMPYFGVRANSLCLPKIASSTARVLLTHRPMPIDIRNGRYFSRDASRGYSSRCDTM